MQLHLTEEQRLLDSTVARLFASESTPERIREAESTGFDYKLWDELVRMGIPLLRVPESQGGSGMGLFDALLVSEQAGRHIASIPLAECIPAAGLLAQLNTPVSKNLLDEIGKGSCVTFAPQPADFEATLVLPGAKAGARVILRRGSELVLLSGFKPSTEPTNLGADAIILAHEDALSCADEVTPLAEGPDAIRHFSACLEEWKLLKAALLTGLSNQAVQMAANYSTERLQFGKPIGSYQGIAHPLADSLTEIEGGRLILWQAAWAIACKHENAPSLISMAWWWTTQASSRATARALHTFGGYGVSLEYDIQLYYRRSKAWALLAGDPQDELARIADRLWKRNGQEQPPLPDAGEVNVEFGLGAQAEAFAEEARAFFNANLTDELRAHAHHSVDGYHAGFNQQLANAGFLYPHWPEEYGGTGKNAFDMAALQEVFEEFNWQRITAPITNQVAQIMMKFGQADLNEEVLPQFAQGRALACLGFSEPASGSDVFSAQTRAEKRADGNWLINGQKIFTTAANLADYCFLLARTNLDAPKHASLTLFLVPMNLAGVEIHPVHTMQDERTNITYFSDVVLDDRYRIGEVDRGVAVMAATLELEHGGDQYRISYRNMFNHALDWARNHNANGQSMLDRDDTRRRLARVATHTMIAQNLCYRAIWGVMDQVPGRAAFGPMSKVFSTEKYQQDAADLMDLFAPLTLEQNNQALGHVEIGYRQSIGMTIYGGTSEIQRSLIAEQALGMPRSRS